MEEKYKLYDKICNSTLASLCEWGAVGGNKLYLDIPYKERKLPYNQYLLKMCETAGLKGIATYVPWGKVKVWFLHLLKKLPRCIHAVPDDKPRKWLPHNKIIKCAIEYHGGEIGIIDDIYNEYFSKGRW